MLGVNMETHSALMEPLESLTLIQEDLLRPDVINDAELHSIPIISNAAYEVNDISTDRSFLLIDENEFMHIQTAEQFCKKLKCRETDKIKVVSIFGNTGDGKSHTMNHVFFNGEEVFKTSPEQHSCTIGVYAAVQRNLGVLCLDTEGLLGTTAKSSRRMRLLLKILAISDIVIYRTRSERLHSDMYEFLGTASKAFCSHFAQALQSLAIPGTTNTLGPAVIIFHETRYTKPLENSVEESAEDLVRKNFEKLNLNINAFSSLRYVGVRTLDHQPTGYGEIAMALRRELQNTAVRSSRQPNVVFQAMRALNLKFSGEITEKPINPFPEQYFTCTVHCESCNRRCQRSMGHIIDGENHLNSHACNYQHKYENKIYLCRACYQNGNEVVVLERTQSETDSSWYGLAKYAWAGSVIECPYHGEIYRARQHWYGNKSPEGVAVRTEIVHVWQGGNITAKGAGHSAQMVLDKVSYLSEAISSISAPPTKALSNWLADKVAPSYWKPNHEIILCHACKKNFEKSSLPKHHCRSCGEGFCHACSQHRMPVPARGWNEPVRVCNACKQDLSRTNKSTTKQATDTNNAANDEADILVRKYGETLYNTLSSAAAVALEYPKEIIKDTVRPDYWVPDAESPNCYICKMLFGTAEELELAKVRGKLENFNSNRPITGDCRRHHCRRCGQAVCEACSMSRQLVRERGWQTEVRVCDSCASMDNKSLNSSNNEHNLTKTSEEVNVENSDVCNGNLKSKND